MLSSLQLVLVVSLLGTPTLAFNPQAALESLKSTPEQSGEEGNWGLPGRVLPQELYINTTDRSLSLQNASVTRVHNYSSFSTKNSILGSLFEMGLREIEMEGLLMNASESEGANNGDANRNINEGQDAATSNISDTTGQETGESDVDLSINLILRGLNGIPSFPHVDRADSLAFSGAEGDEAPFLQYLDGIRKDAWTQFKTMAVSYIELLDSQYEEQEITERLPLDLFRKVLDFGDKMNLLHIVGKKVDPNFVKYLKKQLQPLFSQFETLSSGRVLGYDFSPVISKMLKDAAWHAIHQFSAHILRVTRNYITTEELEEYRKRLAKSVPMAAVALDIFLNGPPNSTSDEGRAFVNRQIFDNFKRGYGSGSFGGNDWYGKGGFGNMYDRAGYSNDYGKNDYRIDGSREYKDIYLAAGHRDGYGGYMSGSDVGYGGYGAHDEYGMSQYGKYLDPYLVLAGLGAAVLLAWIGYKLLLAISSARARKRRDTDDILYLDFSDIPEKVFSMYSLLEDAETKYEEAESTASSLDDWEEVVQGVNSLWRESNQRTGCLKCSFFSLVVDNHFTTPWNVTKQLIL